MTAERRKQIQTIGWRVLPPVFLVVFYWSGLTTWFYQDDFGWLNLRRDIHGWRDLLPALFMPKAHGNMRPWSENGFFVLFSSIFGVHPLPFRIWVFLTMIVNLILLGSIVRRLMGSRVAAFWAQVLWTVNCTLAVVLCWTSIYNEALCAFFLLLAFYLLLRYIETGKRRYWTGQWVAFLLGFGALEINIVYPALAALYTGLYARKLFKKTLPMFLVSGLYFALHFTVAPPPGGVYGLHFDTSMLHTLWIYWTWALGPTRLGAVWPVPGWLVTGATALLTVAAVAFVIRQAVNREWRGVFALAWFVIVLGPLLPLRDHIMDYYLAVPVIGLAILGAWAIHCAFRSTWIWRAAAVLCVGLYLGTSIPAARAVMRWHHARSVAVEDFVLGVADIHKLNPDKMILIAGVNTDLFYAGVVDVPFRVMEIPRVYLVPGSESHIQAPPELVEAFVLQPSLALRQLNAGRAVVYEVDGSILRNVTNRYRAIAGAGWNTGLPRFLNIGDPSYAEFLGLGWYPAEDGYRSMDRRAVFRIGAPRTVPARLHLGVFCPGRLLDKGPVNVRVQVNGTELPPQEVTRAHSLSELSFSLPDSLAGKDEMTVSIAVNRTFLSRDRRDESLRFGFVEVR